MTIDYCCRAKVLESEGAMVDQINRAKGEAEAIRVRAEASAAGITVSGNVRSVDIYNII